jgi:hypothetical protein
VEFNPKIAAVVSAIAFILSFLIGLIGPALIGTVVIRAFAFAVVFFVAGAVFSVVFAKFLLPEEEMRDSSGSDSLNGEREGERQAAGANVNLSVGDDDVFQADAPESDENGARLSGGEEGEGAEDSEGEGAPALEDGIDSEGLEQNNEVRYNSRQGEGLADGGDDIPDEPVFIPGIPGIDGPAAAEERGSLASLPEIGTGTVEMTVRKSRGKEIRLEDLGKNVDGKKVAGAIQTLLRKDEG